MSTRNRIVGIHLDLKYQMPRKTYLLDWVRRLPELGVNTLLIEYEDKFPFSKYPFLRAQGAFTEAELRRLLDAARGAGVRVVPLVQTFAHLEFALNHPQLEHLREQRDIPTHICPSKPEAIRFVHGLIDEVMAFHGPDEFFHIGADEARQLGLCPACRKRMRDREGAAACYREHVIAMCRYVMARGKRPMLWDDAFGFGADPRTIKSLPKEAIPVAWEYGCTKVKPKQYPWMNLPVYRELGYDAIGAPCANYITVFPAARNVYNTALWAREIRKHRMMGMINTMWAGFHMPLAMNWAYIAATGELMKNPDLTVTPAWEDAFYRREFGTRVPGVAQSVRALGEMWEIPIDGMDRPITPIVYCYMDMMLWYPRGVEDRRRFGAYPLDLGEVDFPSIYLKKVRLIRYHPDRDAIIARLRDYEKRFARAVRVMDRLSRSARQHRPEARLFADCARLKWLSARTLDLHVTGRGNAASLLAEWRKLRPALAKSLTPFLESFSVRLLLRLWCDPQMTALRK